MSTLRAAEQGIDLIVSADDFGYFRCVSAGIVHAHRHGIVTATAVLANSPRLQEDVQLLQSCPDLDVGVHLNLTTGRPLSPQLQAVCRSNEGRFPSKFGVLAWFLSGRLREADVEAEWRMQIQACLDAGLALRFLNSHEHVHMFPQALPALNRLAAEFAIPHVRLPVPDRISVWPPGALIRDASLALLSRQRSAAEVGAAPRFLGLEQSGKLTAASIQRWLERIPPGTTCELMCHPGFHDVKEVTDPRIREYHDWEGEVRALTDGALRDFIQNKGIRLISYRDLDARAAT